MGDGSICLPDEIVRVRVRDTSISHHDYRDDSWAATYGNDAYAVDISRLSPELSAMAEETFDRNTRDGFLSRNELSTAVSFCNNPKKCSFIKETVRKQYSRFGELQDVLSKMEPEATYLRTLLIKNSLKLSELAFQLKDGAVQLNPAAAVDLIKANDDLLASLPEGCSVDYAKEKYLHAKDKYLRRFEALLPPAEGEVFIFKVINDPPYLAYFILPPFGPPVRSYIEGDVSFEEAVQSSLSNKASMDDIDITSYDNRGELRFVPMNDQRPVIYAFDKLAIMAGKDQEYLDSLTWTIAEFPEDMCMGGHCDVIDWSDH